jgi:metal-responsive CopG/Arc/MetJ family transcriptional regulator
MIDMKTAISLPDDVFEQADSLALRLHVSRSQLYVMALEKFINEHRENNITEKMNDYIEKHGQPIDHVFLNASLKVMRSVEW